MLIIAIIICAYLFFDAFRHFALSGKSAVKFMQRAGHRLSVSGPPKTTLRAAVEAVFPPVLPLLFFRSVQNPPPGM